MDPQPSTREPNGLCSDEEGKADAPVAARVCDEPEARPAKRLRLDDFAISTPDLAADKVADKAAEDVLTQVVEAVVSADAMDRTEPDDGPGPVVEPLAASETATSSVPAKKLTTPSKEEEGTPTRGEVDSLPQSSVVEQRDRNRPSATQYPPRSEQRSFIAPVKPEFLVRSENGGSGLASVIDDDAAEGRGSNGAAGNGHRDGRGDRSDKRSRREKRGQNKERTFGKMNDELQLCTSRTHTPEFSPRECPFGGECKYEHDLRKFLDEARGEEGTGMLTCPVFEAHGKCPAAWRCKFVRSHMVEIERDDGRKELALTEKVVDEEGNATIRPLETGEPVGDAELRPGIVNIVSFDVKRDLSKRKVDFSKADQFTEWTKQEASIQEDFLGRQKRQDTSSLADLRARFKEPPFLASEKRRIYFGPETPVLAPLTTQGNIPFRRLCVDLGAQFTYSEMVMSLPLVQGQKHDWALMRAHESEISPPKVDTSKANFVLDGYDVSKDVRFGAQISTSTPWQAFKAASALERFCPHLRLIDLNCGCPIDGICKTGAGAGLLEQSNKIERLVRGMNAVSGEIPITTKLRIGNKSNRPVATTIIGKLAFGSREHRARLGAPGCAAVTLHGRSREQRYTRRADWSYIAECAALIKSYNEQIASVADTVREPDARTAPPGQKMYFIGNGDVYSHVDYFQNLEHSKADAIMIGRGALIKPWIFEEIEKGQYLDKSASERLGYIEKFVRYGLEAWGSDAVGTGFTRRFLLEYLSFAHRYIPIGLLEHLPPSMNDRPPKYKGRDEMETLMASDNYRDWIKISEMFLGPAPAGFQFQPKHKSNAYEAEG